MKIYATRDAIGMADDMIEDDKSLSMEFTGENVQELLEQILKVPKFLAFASDTGYNVYFDRLMIAKIENRKVILQLHSPVSVYGLADKEISLKFFHYINPATSS